MHHAHVTMPVDNSEDDVIDDVNMFKIVQNFEPLWLG